MINTKDESVLSGLNLNGITRCLPKYLLDAVSTLPLAVLCKTEELRIVCDRPLMLYSEGTCFFVSSLGKLSKRPEDGLCINSKHLYEVFRLICENSVYAMENEICNGFITLQGGHRAGICGTAVVKNGEVTYIKDISSINIRFARQAKGSADKIIGEIVKNGEVKNTLIISPPGAGKTTLLRDIARKLGNGFADFEGAKVGILDERGEIASVYRGIPQNDIGIRTVVLDACPKISGMSILLRSMGLQVIITDEIGTPQDAVAIESLLCAGVRVIASAHGNNQQDLIQNPNIGRLLGKLGFECIISLSRKNGIGTVEEIIHYDT